MALRSVYCAPDEFHAISVRDLLVQSGIPALIRHNELPMYGGTTFLLRDWGEVLVDEAEYERSLEVVGGFIGTLGELVESKEEDIN